MHVSGCVCTAVRQGAGVIMGTVGTAESASGVTVDTSKAGAVAHGVLP
jgi:hypothetical protein